MAVLQSVSTTHEQIMSWLILNPGVNRRVLADQMGYSETWLSTMINSDVFQAKLKQRENEAFGFVAASIPEKLKVLGDMVVTQLAEQIETNMDKQFTLDAFDKVMKASGYAPGSARAGPGVVQTNNFFGVDKELLQSARESMRISTTVEMLKEVEEVVIGEIAGDV